MGSAGDSRELARPTEISMRRCSCQYAQAQIDGVRNLVPSSLAGHDARNRRA